MNLKDKMSFYDIKISGKDVKRFINNLHKMHIEFLNIVFDKNSVVIKVSERDYKKILDIKTIYEIEVVKLYGIAYYKQFFKRHWIFFLFLSLGFLMFYGLTNVVFEIEVVHNNKELRETIIEELEKEGIYKHGLVVSYQKKEQIKENILKTYKDKIEWLEIERQGTKYIIKVEERKKNNQQQETTPRNIIAKKDGIITEIISSSGEIVTKKNHYVKKGDVLISGIIHNKEEEVARIRAEGLVKAETWYTVTVELPYHYYEEKDKNNKQKILSIKFLDKNLKLFDFKNFKTKKENTIYSLKNNIIPMSLSIVEEQETEVIDKTYTTENAFNEANIIAKQRLKERLGENIEIIYEKKLKIQEENSKIIVVIFYKLYEDITAYQEIDNAIIEDKKDES